MQAYRTDQGVCRVRVACLLMRDWAEEARRPRLWMACLDALEGFTSAVASPTPGEALVDVSGLERHYGDALVLGHLLGRVVANVARGLPAVGIADSPFAARAAAWSAPPGATVAWEPGADAERLAPLPLDRLPLDAATLRTLRVAGLLRLGDLATLPSTVVTARFGLAARHAQRLARGEAPSAIGPRITTWREGSRQMFPTPVYESFRLRSLASIQARDLRARLEQRGGQARRVRLTGEMVNGDVLQRSRLLAATGAPASALTTALDDALWTWPVDIGVQALLMVLETMPQARIETAEPLRLRRLKIEG